MGGLDERWTVVPGGGLSKLPVFLSLFGANDISACVLVDSSKNTNAEMRKLRQTGKVFDAGLITIGDIVQRDIADIEDLFSPSFYLALVNLAYAGSLNKHKLQESDLPKGDRLVARVSEYFQENNINNGKLNHYSPAGVLTRPGSELPTLDTNTINRAIQLFTRINAILP